jgi:hypothetical protein
MRRLALSIFLLFYTFSVAGLTLKRTEEWASQLAGKFKRPQPRHGTRVGEAVKHSPHQVQTKLHEDTSVLIPFLRTSEPPDFKTVFFHPFTEPIPDQKSRAISSRSPPRFL